jgi:hypothetical protein
VLVAGFPAGAFAANCYLVAAGPGEECLIIDPGQDAEPGIEEITERYRLRPAAVLLTHGHLDHMWSVAPVCGARSIPAYVHPADRELLSDPAKGLPLQAGQQLLRGITFTEPDDVVELTGGMTLELAGIQVVADHAPGHTPGSVTFRLPGGTEPGTAVQRRPAVRRIDRADRPAGRRLRDDPGEPGQGLPAAAGRDRGPVRARPADHDRRGAPGQQVPVRAGTIRRAVQGPVGRHRDHAAALPPD